MISKLTAQMVIIFFITLSIVGMILKLIGFAFSAKLFLWYLILITFALIILGRPLTLMALDLLQGPYRENEETFPVSGTKLESPPQHDSETSQSS